MYCFNGNCYLPVPPRAWSRVQNSCSVIAPTNDTDNAFVKVPYTNEVVPYVELGPRLAMLNKGNVLQYKKNSSNLTQWQKYSKIAKGQWVNRTTTWASQSTRGFTDPNTQQLQRVGGTPGTTNSYCPKPLPPLNPVLPSTQGGGGGPDGPPLPPPPPNPPVNPGNVIPVVPAPPPDEPVIFPDFGNLVCGTYENLCTGTVIAPIKLSNCNPTTDSDVPGPIEELCWNDGNPTWYPRQRYIMSNSTDKWPINAVLGSAIRPSAQVLSITTNCGIAELSWYSTTECLPITSYNIFQNNEFLVNINVSLNSYNVTIDENMVNTFYIIALNGTIESDPSNEVNTTIPDIKFTFVGTADFKYTYSYGIYVLTFTNTNGYNEINSLGNFSVNKKINNVNYIVVGGGGGGGGNNSSATNGAGGGAGGCIQSGVTNVTCNNTYPIQVGYGGSGKSCSNQNGCPGGNSIFNNISASGGAGGNSVNNGASGGIGINNGSSGGKGGVYIPPTLSTSGQNTSIAFSIPFSIYTYYFGGGGDGGSYLGQAISSSGGLGGGGCGGFGIEYNNGQAYYGPNGIYYPAGTSTIQSNNGLISSGGGGAGQNGNGALAGFGNGGSGIVVLWFAYP